MNILFRRSRIAGFQSDSHAAELDRAWFEVRGGRWNTQRQMHELYISERDEM